MNWNRALSLGVICVGTLFAFTAPARAFTGMELAYACMSNLPEVKSDKHHTKENAGLCNAYITGWDDARFAFLQGTRTFCPPNPPATSKESSIVFLDYVASHKEIEELPAAEALMMAFKNKWPCQ
jgi:hypothetical protein